MSARCNSAPRLRASLRAATRNEHDALDAALGRLDLAERADYARFLRIQAGARHGVEHYLARQAPAGWCPPRQIPQLARDLAVLGGAPLEEPPAFRGVPEQAEPDAWLGVAWVLAGSSLGNRMMERDLSARAPEGWPMAFLRDHAMPAYFKALRPLLEEARPSPAAERAAIAVFAHFMAEADRQLAPVAQGAAA